MKKSLLTIALACALVFAAYAANAGENAGNPVEQFTGEYWVNTSNTEKEAYLFGIESVVAVEKYISDMPAKGKRGKTVTSLSPFEKGWMEAFRDTPRSQIVKEVDEWYAAHPDKLGRPVLNVIWYDLIAPKLAEAK